MPGFLYGNRQGARKGFGKGRRALRNAGKEVVARQGVSCQLP